MENLMRKLTALFVVTLCSSLWTDIQAAERGKPLKVCILSGCPTYNSEAILPPFQKSLEQNYNVQCVRLVRATEDDLPGLEKLDDCDVALVYQANEAER